MVEVGCFSEPHGPSCGFQQGDPDVNGDGDVNIADLQCTVLFALWQTPDDPESAPACVSWFFSGDLNCDHSANVVDVQLMVFFALNSLVPGISLPPDKDMDADGVHNGCDLCPEVSDPEQMDADGDGVGDACAPPP